MSEVFVNRQFVLTEEAGCYRTLSPLYAFDHSMMGVVELKFRRDVPADRVAEAAANYVRILSQCTPDYGELMSPFDEGFRPGDMLCQKINQMVLARHPDKSGKSKSARGEKRKVIFPAKTKSVSKMIEWAPKNIYFDAHSF